MAVHFLDPIFTQGTFHDGMSLGEFVRAIRPDGGFFSNTGTTYNQGLTPTVYTQGPWKYVPGDWEAYSFAQGNGGALYRTANTLTDVNGQPYTVFAAENGFDANLQPDHAFSPYAQTQQSPEEQQTLFDLSNGARAVGGGLEAASGAALAVDSAALSGTPLAPLGAAGAAWGGALVADGLDNGQAGLRSLATGQYQPAVLETAMQDLTGELVYSATRFVLNLGPAVVSTAVGSLGAVSSVDNAVSDASTTGRLSPSFEETTDLTSFGTATKFTAAASWLNRAPIIELVPDASGTYVPASEAPSWEIANASPVTTTSLLGGNAIPETATTQVESGLIYQSGQNGFVLVGNGSIQTGITSSSVDNSGPLLLVGPNPMRVGRLVEGPALQTIGSTGKVTFTPTDDQINSATFKIIVGNPQFTPSGDPVSTIYDGSSAGGLVEIKSGSSTLGSSYQLRLQIYGSLINQQR